MTGLSDAGEGDRLAVRRQHRVGVAAGFGRLAALRPFHREDVSVLDLHGGGGDPARSGALEQDGDPGRRK